MITIPATLRQLTPDRTVRPEMQELPDPADKAKVARKLVHIDQTFVRARLALDGATYGGEVQLTFTNQAEALALLQSATEFEITIKPKPLTPTPNEARAQA